MESQQNTSSAVPLAIIFGFCMIALAVYFSNSGKNKTKPPQDLLAEESYFINQIKTVDEKDYIRGNPNAPILLIEYSDYECPTCVEFHASLKKIMNEFGASGKVAWVYRQFPVSNIFPNSNKLSETALCVGEIGDNNAFWKFTDYIFTNRQADDLTDMTKLEESVKETGVDRDLFESCIRNGRNKKLLEKSSSEALAAGIENLPHTFVVIGDESKSISGAVSYTVVRQIVKDLIDQLDQGATVPSKILEGEPENKTGENKTISSPTDMINNGEIEGEKREN